MKRLCFIGGVSAVGKSTLIEKITSLNPSFTFNKFHHTLVREFSKREIDLKKALSHWSEVLPFAIETYIGSLSERAITLSDIHYAVQPNYDLAAHQREIISEIQPLDEPYVWGVERKLIKQLLQDTVRLTTLLLTAPSKEIYARRVEKFKREGFARSLKMESIEKESEMELQFFKEITKEFGIDLDNYKLINNSQTNYERNIGEVIKFLKGQEPLKPC